MMIKRSYHELMCDRTFPNGRCHRALTFYTPGVHEGAAGEYAIREARAEGWKVVSKGRRSGYAAFCPEHRTGHHEEDTDHDG